MRAGKGCYERVSDVFGLSSMCVQVRMHACACTHAYAGMGVQCKKGKGFESMMFPE